MNRARTELEIETLGIELDLDRSFATEPGLEQLNTSPELRLPAREGVALEQMLESPEALTRFVAGFFGDLGITDACQKAKGFVDGLIGSAERVIFGDTPNNNSEAELTPIPVESKVREFRTLGND